jgi:hypothetical protein
MILSPVQPNPRGEYLGTEEVLAVAVGTNSGSTVGQCNFIFQKLGICLEQGNAELVLNPQNILDINATTLTTTTSVKPTTILDLNNQAGTAGQILSSTSTGIDWIDPPSGTTPNLGEVLTAGGNGGGGSITNVASITATTSVKPITILDKDNQAGTAGQLLSSTATGIDWIDPPSGTTPNIGEVITAGGNAGGGTITNLSSLSATGTLTLGTNSATTAITVGSSSASELLLIPPLKVGTLGNAGLAGQYLTSSSGSANTWTTPYVNASNGQVAGNLLLQGNDINGVDAIDGNFGGLSIGRGLGTTNTISIGKAGLSIDLINTVRLGADGAVSEGTAGQVATSGGAGQFTRWANIALTNAQRQLTTGASGLGGGLNRLTNVNFTVVNGGKYLVMGSFNIFNSTSNTGSIWCGLCQQPEIVTPNTDALNLTTGVSLSTTTLNDSNSLAVQRNSGVSSGDAYTLSPSYVWTSNVDGVRTFSAWALAQPSGPLYSGTVRNYNLQITRIA